MGKTPDKATRTSVFHNNTYNISSRGNNNRITHPQLQWTTDEHHRFLAGLEKYGAGQAATAEAAWEAITAIVRTRTVQEVQMHASRYFQALETVNTQKRKEFLLMQSIDTRWTLEEDELFEQLLAQYSTVAVCYPWDEIAAKIAGKTARDVKDRYEKLCYDIARIEAGQHVMMHLGRFPRKSPADTHQTPTVNQQTSPLNDCVVTLTRAEEEVLMSALEEVHVPTHVPPEVLASVASAVAAFANSKSKLPPQRTVPLFTKDQARDVLTQLIQAQQTEPHVVLETLVMRLKLHPLARLDISAGMTFGTPTGNAMTVPRSFSSDQQNQRLHTSSNSQNHQPSTDQQVRPAPVVYLPSPSDHGQLLPPTPLSQTLRGYSFPIGFFPPTPYAISSMPSPLPLHPPSRSAREEQSPNHNITSSNNEDNQNQAQSTLDHVLDDYCMSSE